ncbi:HNH endonuclease [Delftia sp. CH05]|uniref:HNH endonuclease n=1 Tax=Delftia sp. CH05 TaxID=2692194 RepID=UPI00135DDC5A|nr:HNH endonuclease [Delftia sp. CH05]MXN28143.1 hypothetical protein [Delftia sp. CH05]
MRRICLRYRAEQALLLLMNTCHHRMRYPNQICPYTSRPVGNIEASREHIVPDAIGGPDKFSLAACKQYNSRYGATVDVRLTKSPLMGMLAAAADVETRNGPASWTVQGQLVADGSPVEITGAYSTASFRFRKPVAVDGSSPGSQVIKGFGAGLDKEVERVSKDLQRKGRRLEVTGTQNVGSAVRGHFEHNLAEAAQGLTKIAYLATVWALGDGFIGTAAGALYRSWIDAAPSSDALSKAGLKALDSSVFKRPGRPTQHDIVCFVSGHTVVTGVRLFNERLFEIAIAVEVPEVRLPDQRGRLITIDAVTKTFTDELMVP